MSGINFLSDNLTDNASYSLTTGTENTQFPLSNLVNNTTVKKFRSVGNTAVIVVDLLTTRDIDIFSLVGDATGTFGVSVVTIKTSVTTDFSSSPLISIPISAENNIGYKFITPVTHRYVEVTLTGTGAYVELSKMFIGEKINLPDISLSIDSFGYGHKDLSQVRNNEYGQRFINKRNKTKEIKGQLDFATQSETDTLDDMFLTHGLSTPLWVILDTNSDALIDGDFKLSMYGYMDSMPKWSANGGKQYSAPITMSEVI